MKKSRVFALGLLSVLCAGALNAQAADTGTITFNGSIVDNTCSVSVDGQGADGTVTLPDVTAATLKEKGSTAGKTGFKLEVSGCTGVGDDGIKTVAIYLDVSSDAEVSTAQDVTDGLADKVYELFNQASNGAEHVLLKVIDEQDSQIMPITSHSTGGSTITDISKDGFAELPFSVEYHSAGNATSGPVTARTIYRMAYK
jgi:major type 1 subunit fimbrin (pilin)